MFLRSPKQKQRCLVLGSFNITVLLLIHPLLNWPRAARPRWCSRESLRWRTRLAQLYTLVCTCKQTTAHCLLQTLQVIMLLITSLMFCSPVVREVRHRRSLSFAGPPATVAGLLEQRQQTRHHGYSHILDTPAASMVSHTAPDSDIQPQAVMPASPQVQLSFLQGSSVLKLL